MLNVQKWLIDNSFDYTKLEAEFGITANFHPTDDRVILNYSQINSPKTDSKVIESRGLVLNRHTGEIIAKSFDRFFNYGESGSDRRFDWDDCTVTHKEDGSLILLYHYDGQWRVNTRNSYGDGYVVNDVITWKELFLEALPEGFKWDELQCEYTYVLELCSRYNKIVRDYPVPTVSLLSVFDNGIGCMECFELNEEEIDVEAKILGLSRPKSVTLQNILSATAYVGNLAKEDATFEGIVARDKNGYRVKIKSQTYVELHRLCNNHQLTPERLFNIVASNEADEVITYFPELAGYINQGIVLYNDILSTTQTVFDQFKHLESQKDFAISVKDHPYAAAIFNLRKTGKIDQKVLKTVFERHFSKGEVNV